MLEKASNLRNKLQTAISNPSRIRPWIRRQTNPRLRDATTVLTTSWLPQQEALLDDLRTADDWLLIVFDACRYDFFSEVVPSYIDGDLQPARSAALDTMGYVGSCWDGSHPDVTYLSGAVPINSKSREEFQEGLLEEQFNGVVPSEAIGEVVDIWERGWDESLGTCPPEAVTSAARERLDERQLVVHYYQPHAPFIGDLQKLGHTNDEVARLEKADPVDGPIWEQARTGKLSTKRLGDLYRSNLEHAVRACLQVIDESDHERIVITADHGEALGEFDVWAHPRQNHPKIRKIPWLEVDGVKPGVDVPEVVHTDRAVSDASMTDRLEELGYL